jgi:hypothetical protein
MLENALSKINNRISKEATNTTYALPDRMKLLWTLVNIKCIYFITIAHLEI